jgi:hypothetical protein
LYIPLELKIDMGGCESTYLLIVSYLVRAL